MGFTLRHIVSALFARAGIEIGGTQPWDIQVLHPRFYRRALRGSLGLGESYMDGDWTVAELDAFFRRIISAGLAGSMVARVGRMLLEFRSRLTNMQTRRRAVAVAEQHYDLDHRLYEMILGPWNQYTCCFFDGTDDLAEAEVRKLEMICNKLEIGPSDRVLDIGCGWGGFARHAAEHHGVSVIGITLSPAQAEYARNACRGLPVRIELCDYRDFRTEALDRIVSIGMFEHVGKGFIPKFMKRTRSLLKPGGIGLIHTVGKERDTAGDPFTMRYVFPGAYIPVLDHVIRAMGEEELVPVDIENLRLHYASTLDEWGKRFEANSGRIEEMFDARFVRMWRLFLNGSAAAFRWGNIRLYQILFTNGLNNSLPMTREHLYRAQGDSEDILRKTGALSLPRNF